MTLPLDPADLWHTGIIVDDLDAAKAELGEALGLTWLDGGAAVRVLTDDGPTTVTTAYALSRQGPHHIELGQSIPGTLWTTAAPGQAHHVGYWVDDVAATSAALIAHGATRLASVAMSDDAPPMCAYHQTENGLIVEIVTCKMKRMLLPHDEVES